MRIVTPDAGVHFAGLSEGQYKDTIAQCRKLIQYIRSCDPYQIPGIERVRPYCLSLIGRAYTELGDDKKALAFHQHDLQNSSERYVCLAMIVISLED